MFDTSWDSLRTYGIPDWFRDAKLGIFIHWGVYSVPAWDNEWYPRFMYRDEMSRKGQNYYRHHCDTWGHPGTFGYKDFIPMFKAEHWDPEQWVDLFQAAGARYVVPVGEHHDGFPMYKSQYTKWNAADMGPRRDVVAELERIVRRRNLKFGVSSHRAFNWRYYTYRDDFDTSDPAHADLYSPAHAEDEPTPKEWIEDWYRRTQEMIDRFEPDVLWFDFGWHADEFADWRPQVLAYYYNQSRRWGRDVVLQYKDKFPPGVACYDIERGKLDDIREEYWQTDTAVSYKSWSHIENDEFKTATTLVHDLVDIVSKNGNLLLNVGPRADGIIPNAAADLLRDLGAWLNVNGEAIYGTRHWHTFGEGPTRVTTGHLTERENAGMTAEDIRFTTTKDALYAILLGWPGNTARVQSVTPERLDPARVADVSLLGGPGGLDWTMTDEGLTVQLPDAPTGAHAHSLKLSLKPH